MATINELLARGYSRREIAEAVVKKYGKGSPQAAQAQKQLEGSTEIARPLAGAMRSGTAYVPQAPTNAPAYSGATPGAVNPGTGLFSTVNPQEMTEAEKADVYKLEQAARQPFYQRKIGEYGRQAQETESDYERLVGYAKSDAAKALASENRTFARTLRSAFDAYGKRGLIGSGIQAAAVTEAMADLDRSQADRRSELDKTLESYQIGRERTQRKIEEGKRDFMETEEATLKSKVIDEESRRKAAYYQTLGISDKTSIKSDRTTNPYYTF